MGPSTGSKDSCVGLEAGRGRIILVQRGALSVTVMPVSGAALGGGWRTG